MFNNLSRFPISGDRFKFTSFSNHLDRLKYHVLRDKQGLLGEFSDFLLVGLDLLEVGDGLASNLIIQADTWKSMKTCI